MANVPDYLANRGLDDGFGDPNELLGGIGAALPAHLSINMNQFALVDSAGNRRDGALTIDICIIAANDKASRIYYDPSNPYDPSGSDNAPPLCWSDNGVGPSSKSSVPQATTCAVCPNAVWGSATSKTTGKGIPACQTGKKVAFIVPSDADDICYMFKIPPASLKNLSQYVKTLAGHMIGSRPARPSDVITRLSFESQGVVKFVPVGLVDEDTFNRTEHWYGQPDALKQITGRDDVARDPSLPIGVHTPAPKEPTIRQQALNTIVKPVAPPVQPTQEPKKRGRPAKSEGVTNLPNFMSKPTSKPEAVGPGMVEAKAPSSEISAALDNVFNLPGLT